MAGAGDSLYGLAGVAARPASVPLLPCVGRVLGPPGCPPTYALAREPANDAAGQVLFDGAIQPGSRGAPAFGVHQVASRTLPRRNGGTPAGHFPGNTRGGRIALRR